MEQDPSEGILPPQVKKISEDEMKLIQEFRARKEVQEYLKPKHVDLFVLRYLRARKFNVHDAVTMFVNSMKWRIKVDADNMNDLFSKNKHREQLLAYWPASAYWPDPPFTNDGSTIIFEALGRVDPSIIDAVGIDNLIQYHIWSMEQLEAKWFKMVEEKGYWTGFVMFEDLGGLGWHSLSSKVLSVCQEIVNINQNYYPDMLRKMWVLNVPSIFFMSWKVIQLWLDPRTLVKIELCSGSIEDVKERVYKVIEKDAMPVRLLGNSERDIGLGGEVSAPSMDLQTKVKGWIDVPRSGRYEKEYQIEKGDIVSWQFKTKSNDVGFSVTFEGNNIIDMERHDSDKRIIEGSFTAEASGSYKFIFDNTYSWTRGKQVKYNLRRNNIILFPVEKK